MKITPILIVDEIEPSLKFWADKLGFEKTVEVPEGDKLGFVILQKDGTEIMLQSRESVKKDAAGASDAVLELSSSLYIEVDDFDNIPVLANRGGWGPANKAFEGKLGELLEELNEELVAA